MQVHQQMDVTTRQRAGSPCRPGIIEEGLNPHSSPPEALKIIFKRWKQCHSQDLTRLSDCTNARDWSPAQVLENEKVERAFQRFLTSEPLPSEVSGQLGDRVVYSYESRHIPGLTIIPNFLPGIIQNVLLRRLIYRDLSNPIHQTNLHLHYDVKYPEPADSFFNLVPDEQRFFAKDISQHPNLSVGEAFEKKLRWMTLGGQYDWTKKKYPSESPPNFPQDIYGLLHESFPDIEPQAAIVNFYSPGNTLSLHRDVSEEIDRGLVSISVGCDCLFIIGLRDCEDVKETGASRHHVLRLRSGDAVIMSGKARYAWHGVPKVIKDSCPDYLWDWPGNGADQCLQGYMRRKRINLNVRQMR